MNLEEKYNNIKTALGKIEVNKITVLTGENASGKSLLQKVIWSQIKEQVNDGRPIRKYIWETSMRCRTSQISKLGAMSGMFRDNDMSATSENSIENILRLLTVEEPDMKHYIVLDEPEIGCGEEVQLGIANWINAHQDYIYENTLGILIITHSRIIVSNVKHDKFINMEQMDEEEWLNRTIVARDIEDLVKESMDFFVFLRDNLTSRPSNSK